LWEQADLLFAQIPISRINLLFRSTTLGKVLKFCPQLHAEALTVNPKRLVVLAIWFCVSPLVGQSLDGRWNGTVKFEGAVVPFRLDLAGNGSQVSGSLFNGSEKITSNNGQFQNGSLELNFDAYASKIKATWKDGSLQGEYFRAAHDPMPFAATRYTPVNTSLSHIPQISGKWELQTHTHYGESAQFLIVRQSGVRVNAAISRVDGDTGNIEGVYQDGKFVLGHFDGARPLVLEIIPAADGSLNVTENGHEKQVALRPSAARAKGLAPPVDPLQHTRVKNPAEPLRFSFPDLNGHTVTNNDPQFRGKVVLVTMSGSWCPNCHDEAPLLESLYRKYHDRGLEVVAVSFEEGDQLKNPVRLKAFIKQYGITYTEVLAGEPTQLAEKFPQAVNLDAFPTTFFLDRSGRVQSIHTGFAGIATGDLYKQLVDETTEKIEHLLAENRPEQNKTG
jgi:peroxiredoxin